MQWDYDSIYAEINNKTFVSRTGSNGEIDYEVSITFSDLDMESRTVTVTYRIDDLNYGDLSFVIEDVDTGEYLENISGSKVGSIEYIEDNGCFKVTVAATGGLKLEVISYRTINVGFTLRPTEFSIIDW